MGKYRLGPIIVFPFWSQSDNLNVDSGYAYLSVVLPEMVKQTEDTIFMLLFPNPRHGNDKWTYTPDGLQSERIRFIPWNYDTQMSTSVTAVDIERWKRLEDEIGPMIYWLNQVEAGAILHGGYYHSYAKSTQPTLIAQHHYIVHRSMVYSYSSQFPRQWFQIGGSLASDKVIYNSDYCHKMAQESFSEYLNAETMDKLEDKSRVLRFGLLRGDEPLAPEATDQTPVFLYNHRFEYYKRPDITFALFDQFRNQYPNLQVWVTQTEGQMTGGKKGYTFDKVIFHPSRMTYLQRAAVPAINTINSTHETFCISILDSMALGHLVVVPRDLTFPELLPPDYPYFFKTPAEQAAMIDAILATWPNEYNRWRLPLSEYAHRQFNLSKYVADYLGLIWEAESFHREGKPKSHILNGLQKAFSAMIPGKRYSPKDLKNGVHRIIGNLGAQSMNERRCLREALSLRDDTRLVWEDGIKIFKE